ncbi:MAG: hypothetical protein PHR68_04720 [Candidatus Gracilibacteria bacterium]|nr:hypothetical protein [Candidatus Gracilibacteria bacterium]
MLKKLLKYKKSLIFISIISVCSVAVFAATGTLNNETTTNNNTADTNSTTSNLNTEVSSSCKYKSEIERCRDANKTGTNRSIDPETEFVCIASQNMEQIAYTVILDKEFKEIDKKMLEYLIKLDQDKDKYFANDSKETMYDAVSDLQNMFGETSDEGFFTQYKSLCSSDKNIILKETMDCLGGKTSIINAKDFIDNRYEENSCLDLAKTKLDIYYQVALNVIKLNKEQVLKDERKKYTQQQRIKYDKLIDNMTLNMNYIEKINAKRPTVSKTVHSN